MKRNAAEKMNAVNPLRGKWRWTQVFQSWKGSFGGDLAARKGEKDGK